jgi:hypothetical protein
MPDELKSRIAAAAEAAGRSLHAELLVRLDQSFQNTECVPTAQYESLEKQLRALVKAHEAEVEAQKRLLDISQIDRSLMLMTATNTIGMGRRLLRVLDALDDTEKSRELKEMRPEAVNVIDGAEHVIEYVNRHGKLDADKMPWLKLDRAKP